MVYPIDPAYLGTGHLGHFYLGYVPPSPHVGITSLTDPRYVVMCLLDDYFAGTDKVTKSNLTLKDGVSYANYEACYECRWQNMYMLFHEIDIDLLFVVKRRGVEKFPANRPPVAYIHHLVVQPVAIDKYYADGTLKVSATELVDKASQEVRHVLRDNMGGSMRLSEREESHIEQLTPSLFVYGDEVGVDYTQYVSNY